MKCDPYNCNTPVEMGVFAVINHTDTWLVRCQIKNREFNAGSASSADSSFDTSFGLRNDAKRMLPELIYLGVPPAELQISLRYSRLIGRDDGHLIHAPLHCILR